MTGLEVVERVPESFAINWTASSNSTGTEEIVDLPSQRPFEVTDVVFWIESGAPIASKQRLMEDGNGLVPSEGWYAGGGDSPVLPASIRVQGDTLHAQWDNGDSSDREMQIIVMGDYLEVAEG